MRVGSLVFATEQGIGILAKAFHEHGVITDVVTVAHGRRPEHLDWYAGSMHITSFRDRRQRQDLFDWAAQLDVLLAIETPFEWSLFPHCREHGVKTVLFVNHECMPRELPYQPDLFLCPSPLDRQYFPDRSVYLPVPVDTKKVPWRLRERAREFVHNAGHGGLKGRNGTAELVEALPLIKNPAVIVINTQDPLPRSTEARIARLSSEVDVHLFTGTMPYEKLWAEGDAFVFPHRFDGLSLPLQEARASGMLVLGVDRFPDYCYLPRAPLIPTVGSVKSSVHPSCLSFDEAVIEPKDIAAKIDEWYDRDITELSLSGRQWAEEHAWEKWKDKYLEVLAP